MPRGTIRVLALRVEFCFKLCHTFCQFVWRFLLLKTTICTENSLHLFEI
ncbi:uncharacterized protein METZ01_LOCUS370018, partial [marine metagenome]